MSTKCYVTLQPVLTIITHHQTIGYAATYGIITQAHLEGQQYSLLLTLFYIAYLVSFLA